MATSSHAHAVKSLNKSTGRRRFVFKSLSQKIEEIEIDVFRSLDKIKSEPSEGSTFFRDCLVEWRELNTAEDFISFYEKMMPFVQTLPLLLLHKESIMSELLCRLQLKARLSLEPILRLVAALSRDLLEDFIIFLPRIVDSLVSLLKSGADREPEIVEQVFTSWSSILMFLQKYLVNDIVQVMKVTVKLRYYPKEYVQELMAAAISFLLRNAPNMELAKGIRKLMLEVVKKPLSTHKYGASALAYFVMRGTASRFHSRAGYVLQHLTSNSILAIGDAFNQGSDSVVEVVSNALQRLCEDMEIKELDLMWNLLYKEIEVSAASHNFQHLSSLLSVLLSVVQVNDGCLVSDYRPMLELVESLIQKFIVPAGEEVLSAVVDKVLLLMLSILDGLNGCGDISTVSCCSLKWAAVFRMRNSSCLSFIKELQKKDSQIVLVFRDNILRVLNDLIETSPEEIMYLLLLLVEKLQKGAQEWSFFDGLHEETSNLRDFLEEAIRSWVGIVDSLILGDGSILVDDVKLALLWAVIYCYPHVMGIRASTSSLMDFINAVDRLLVIEADYVAGVLVHVWQSLIGSALRSHYKCKSVGCNDPSYVLHLAKKYRSCPEILSAAADYLDRMHGTIEPSLQHRTYHTELEAKNAEDAFSILADNLYNANKGIRLPTLRILCHYEPQECEISAEGLAEKKMTTEFSQIFPVDSNRSDVLQLLLLIEATPLSIDTSRNITLMISKIQSALKAGRISKSLLPLVLSGLIGIFHNRFSHLWNPASECLAILIGNHVALVWEKFVDYFERCQSWFQAARGNSREYGVELAVNSKSDLVGHFKLYMATASDSTPSAMVVSSLLQSLQKCHSVAESRSRQIIPLFLKFLGYDNDHLASVGSFDSDACKGKEWKGILKEWLNFLKLLRNTKALYRSQFVKDVLQIRLMDENDAEIQMKVLECLLTWKDDFLLPYEHHLRNLICSKSLREEITTWSLSRESYLIGEGHRAHVVPIVIRLLMSKVRKLKTLASRKHASVHHRKAVLRFLAQLEVEEIPLFFMLLIQRLHIAPPEIDDTGDLFWSFSKNSVDNLQWVKILKYFTNERIEALSLKKRYGFLHVIEDILGVFDEMRTRPFLDLLMGCVVRILGNCTSSLDSAKAAEYCDSSDNKNVRESNAAGNEALTQTQTATKQLKEMRSLCLKVVSLVLNKYDDHEFSGDVWDIFFASVKSLIQSFKQEGASSERPSSLFSCFLAMSRSPHLVPLLQREKDLVPDIFSILTVATASEAIMSSALEFIENLLNLDNEYADDDNAVKEVMLLNRDYLFNSLHSVFQCYTASKRKLVKFPEERKIKIFKLLVKYVMDQSAAKKFVDILLPFLASRNNDSDTCLECLQIIQAIIPALGNQSTMKILHAVSPLLILAELDMRLRICDLLDALARSNASFLLVATFIRQLNSVSPMEVYELDYDSIVDTYQKIGVDFFHKLEEEHALVILSHCVHDMSSEELILRHSAYQSLLSFVEFAAKFLGGKLENYSEIDEPMLPNIIYWTREGILRIVNQFLLNHLGYLMKAGRAIRKEWMELLRAMVLKLPNVANLNSFKGLCSEDAEHDFFNNIMHLQKHRRMKALSLFKNEINRSNMSEDILNGVFVPLFFNMLSDIQNGKGEHFATVCVDAIASVSGHMGWKSYYTLLIKCFKEINVNRDKQNMNQDRRWILSRLICSILDQFHFAKVSSQEVEQSLDTVLKPYDVNEIQICLRKTVLPKVQKLLDSDADKANVNASVAALKLLKLLPGDIMDSQLPSIIHHTANQLKSRKERDRDGARMALVACLQELGLEYLQFVVKVLQATLKRGYELHVLGYSIHFILSKLVHGPHNGKLDYCLDDLLSVVESDIFGDVADEKEVEKIASKMKETEKQKSFETLKMIAQGVTFKSNALKLLTPVTGQMQKHLAPKLKSKLENVLSHISAGIAQNPSVDQKDLLIFIYGLIDDGTNEEAALGGKDPSCAVPESHHKRSVNGKRNAPPQLMGTKSSCSHLIMVFALDLFHNHMRSVKRDSSDELLSMLDPFVKLLGNCLSSKYEDVLTSSLRCLTPLISLPLPSVATEADRMKIFLMDIVHSCVNVNSPLGQSCLRLLTVLLQKRKITLSSEQLHMVIQLPLFVDLERNPSFVALSLLEVIVKRKLVVPEIYDIIFRVAELMVTSQDEEIRKKSRQILLLFLLNYHLSGAYLKQNLDFLMKNLSYEYFTGREAVLEMLRAIITKASKSFLDNHALELFIHLVQCLANDAHENVRLMTGGVIKLLIDHISPHVLDRVLDFSISWYMDEKRQLQSAGAQVIGLLVEGMGQSFKKHINKLLPMSSKILKAAVKAVTGSSSQYSSDVAVPFWKEAYYSLEMLEKILRTFYDLSCEREFEDAWAAICDLLLHPHSWMSNISNRLLAFYFETVTQASGESHKSLGNFFLVRPGRLFTIAVSLCHLLKTRDVDNAVSNLVTHNLSFTICCLHSLMGRVEYDQPPKFWANLEQVEQTHFFKAFQLLDSRKGKDMFLQAISSVHDQTDGMQHQNLRHFLISSLLKKMGKVALEMEAVQMRIVFNCYSNISTHISWDECQNYAFDMLSPLYKVCEGYAGKEVSVDLKQLAEDVLKSITNTLGVSNCAQIYGDVRNSLKVKRVKRKREEKLMVVTNPTRNAKRKLKMAAKHGAHKKRKMMTMKMARWMH